MKKKLSIVMAAALAVLLMTGCKKDETTETTPTNDALDQSEMRLIEDAGLNPGGAIKTEGKYLIEGDLLLSADELRALVANNGPELIVANDEQYRTTNLVTSLPRVIKVRYTGGNAAISAAVNNAIARYNARALRVTFQRVTTGQNINITHVTGVSYIASAGFPSSGNPYNTIRFNTAYAGWGSSTLTTILAHELGHCIGFRHTDYMQREYSCGGAHYNEGSAGIGAIHIPGTPTGPVANSWMLACISNGVNRPFNTSDRTALAYVY